jgi:D-tagatose-1,6-bisphosphate aldolase subunit GatZ/KbaZ
MSGYRPLIDVVKAQKRSEPVGLTSVCSAHPLVLEAAVLQARDTSGCVLLEATSNQVDQSGGYTGMRPGDFRQLVHGIAERCGLPLDRVVLGGDHLGPNRWRSLPAEQAMQHAEVLVAAYVAAGFTKIHLDCSFSCKDDPTPVTDDLAAGRAARLMRVAEDTATAGGVASELRFVIGTEVPVPGGAHETLQDLAPTTAQAAAATLSRHHQAVAEQDLDHVWPRIMALVVQPGVEFDHSRVVDYQRARTTALQAVLDDEPNMVFEAHSTDYQTLAGLTALVQDHWAVLKVGPGLTFALREALFALAAIEEELIAPAAQSHLREVVEARMLADPSQWQDYYPGDRREQRLAQPVQLQRPAALLLAGPAGSLRPEPAPGEPGRARSCTASDQRLPAAAVRADPSWRARRTPPRPGHRPCPRRPAGLWRRLRPDTARRAPTTSLQCLGPP